MAIHSDYWSTKAQHLLGNDGGLNALSEMKTRQDLCLKIAELPKGADRVHQVSL